MAGRLADKVCVTTGTGGSMGRATALMFAREGALVVGCDVTVDPAAETVEMVRASGGKMVSLQPCLLDDPSECARLVDLAVSEFGRIDVLFNLAARSHFSRAPVRPIRSWRSPSWSDWECPPRAGRCSDAEQKRPLLESAHHLRNLRRPSRALAMARKAPHGSRPG
jgi:NAD(P)-dependent dehydrogenase (short-subunit alcohol dehydrogenase family)